MRFETGVPIPQTKRGGRPPTPHSARIQKMKVGDSILCETPGEVGAARRIIYAFGGRPLSRKSSDGWRVWRVE